MGHIQTFTISGHEFRHVESGDESICFVKNKWKWLRSAAAFTWRGEADLHCAREEPYRIFSIYDPSDSFWGVWSLYRIRDITPTSISALCSPTFPTVASNIPQDSFGPDGTTIINADDVSQSTIKREQFWRQTFACIESMLLFPMQLNDGSSVSVDHFRFPSVADEDPAQHEWSGGKDQFDRYCKIEVEFDANGTAVKTLPSWKSVDPDPERSVGEFDV